MKRYFLTPILLLVLTTAFGQPAKKPASKDKPPTQMEMQDMMKQMQKELDQMSPEDKKLLDSMGFKMPDTKGLQKTVAGMSDAQVNQAYEEANRIVPQKDAARISQAQAITLTEANKKAFIAKTHQEVLARLSAGTKTAGAELLQKLKQLDSSLSNIASGFWMEGKPGLALYLMGEACIAHPEDDNSINNYASFLTTCGGEQMALPMLNFLNKQYPQNSTVLNNIAQAWLGLGDIQRAEKYADSAILIYAAHPQANMAKCLIEESKGRIPEAIKAGKRAISEAYSIEKASKLSKLGYDLKSDDLNWVFPLEHDALGLDQFTWPEYPLDVEQNEAAEMKWTIFKDACEAKIEALREEQERAEENYTTMAAKRNQQAMEAAQKGEYFQMMPGMAAKAIKKLGPGIEDIYGNMTFVFAPEMQPIFKAMETGRALEETLAEKQKAIDEKYKNKIGEGRENPLEAVCKDENRIRTEFLKDANGTLQTAYRQYLHYASRRTSDLMNYYQYTMWPEQFELMKINARIAWLESLKGQRPYFKNKSTWCIAPAADTTGTGDSVLANFDDVACKYVSVLHLGVYKIVSSCSNLTGEFSLNGIKINIKDNVETGKYSGSVIVGVSKGYGPATVKAKASIAALVEFDNSGITDIGAIAGAGIKTKSGQTIVGGEMKATYNTGISMSGKFLGKK